MAHRISSPEDAVTILVPSDMVGATPVRFCKRLLTFNPGMAVIKVLTDEGIDILRVSRFWDKDFLFKVVYADGRNALYSAQEIESGVLPVQEGKNRGTDTSNR